MSDTSPSQSSQKQSVRDHFGPVADRYASAGVHRAGPDLEALAEDAARRAPEVALDVGCGAGHTALAVAPHAGRVHAVDLTQPMLDQTARLAAERGLDNVEVHLGDAEALPWPDGGFDLVTCRLCAHHFQRPQRALAEMHRVLAPGGRLLVVDIVAAADPGVDTFLNAIEIVRDPSHVRDYTLAEWRTMLTDVGFRVDRCDTFPMRIDFEAWLVRIGAPPEACTALRWMFGQATAEARAELAIDARFDFTLTNALFACDRPD